MKHMKAQEQLQVTHKCWPAAAVPCMQEIPSLFTCPCHLPQLSRVCFSPSMLVMCKSRVIEPYSLHFLKQLLGGEESATCCPWHWHERLQTNSRGYMHTLGVTLRAWPSCFPVTRAEYMVLPGHHVDLENAFPDVKRIKWDLEGKELDR